MGASGDRNEEGDQSVSRRPGHVIWSESTEQGQTGRHVTDKGVLLVREHPDYEHSRLIELPLLRLRSVGRDPAEPVFLLGGGPGLPNLREGYAPEWLLGNHDVVMLGYRGVEGSVSLDAPELNQALKRIGDPLSEEGLREVGEVLDEVLARLHHEGTDVAAYNPLNSAEDVELARQALGYERISLSNASYGGVVAYLYCIRYPERVRRNLMAVPSFPWTLNRVEPAAVEEVLKRLNEQWKQDPRCVEKSPDIVQTMRQVIDTLPVEWHGIRITPGRVRLVTYLCLYDRNRTAQAFDAFAAAGAGDYSGLAFMSLMWDQVVDMFNWGDAWVKMASTIPSPETAPAQLRGSRDSVLGSPLAELGWGALRHAAWRVAPIPEKYRSPRETGAETLIVSAADDVAVVAPTAYIGYFTDCRNVLVHKAGHTDVKSRSVERSFFLDGSIEDLEHVGTPRRFVPDQTFQEQAWALLGSQQ